MFLTDPILSECPQATTDPITPPLQLVLGDAKSSNLKMILKMMMKMINNNNCIIDNDDDKAFKVQTYHWLTNNILSNSKYHFLTCLDYCLSGNGQVKH